MPTDARTARGLRDRPLGKALILGLLLLVAFLATRSCAQTAGDVSQDEAVAIAKQQVDFDTDRVNVRLFRSGIPSRAFWAVTLSALTNGRVERQTLVVVDASSGRVDSVQDVNP